MSHTKPFSALAAAALLFAALGFATTVLGAGVAAIIVAPAQNEIHTGATLILYAVALDSAGVPVIPQPSITWTSSNPSVASVNGSGVVTGVSAGTATITAAVGAINATAAIAVVDTTFSISTSPDDSPLIDPVHTFPVWFEDVGSGQTKLQPCLGSATGGTGVLDFNCPIPDPAADPLFNPNAPVVFPTNFPKHPIYWSAGTEALPAGTGGALAKFHYALEGAFATADGSPAANSQIAELVATLDPLTGLTPGATYRVTHPFGSFDITADASGNTAAVLIRDGATLPNGPAAFTDLLPAPATQITKFLRQVDPVPLLGYIGDGVSPSTIENGPNGNMLRIAGPAIDPTNADGDGNPDLLTVSKWVVAGKLFTPTIRETVPVPPTVSAKTIPYSFSADDFGPITVSGPDCALDPASSFFSNSDNSIVIDVAHDGAHACSVSIANGDGQESNVLVAAFMVESNPVASAIAINPSLLALVAGGSQQLSAAVTDQFGNTMSVPITWTSDNPAIATVDSTGKVSALAAGSATVSASTVSAAGTIRATSSVTVTAPPAPVCETDADADGDGTISELETLNYVHGWKVGSVESPLLFKAIGFWKRGTGC